MQAWLNSAVMFFPLALGVVYGLSYALSGYIYKQAPLGACLLLSSFISFLLWLTFSVFNGTLRSETIGKVPPHVALLIVANGALTFVAWLMASYGMKHISPTYVAAGEVSYVLFTPIMAYLIFGRKEVDAYTLVAGLMILAGVAVLIYGRTKAATPVAGVM